MGWGGKLRDSLLGPAPEDLAQASIEAVNARDWEALRRLLSSGFQYRDRDGNRLDSPQTFVAALQAMVANAPDFRLEVDSYQRLDATVLMRGRTASANRDLRSESVWKMEIRRGRIRSLESYHANEAMKLYGYAPQ
jgi:hypothetical protein